MAIVFEQPKKPFNWVRILFIVFTAGFVVFAVYYLFFAPSPKIEVVLPPPLMRASQISGMEFVDPAELLNSKAFLRLSDYALRVSAGTLGRSNPFIKL